MSWTCTDFKKWIDVGCDASKAKTVRTLSLHGNKLSSIPESFGQLVNLRTLYLSFNDLTSLPEWFGQLVNLWTLYLNDNNLTSLPESFGQLVNLRTLFLSSNKLSSLPKSFGQLVNLRVLHLSHNELSSLPESFGQLVNIRELYLYNNELSSLPEWFSQLVNLHILYLYNNNLSSLPDSFEQLVNIRTLDLQFNKLTSIAPCLGNLPQLEYFLYIGNPIEHIPANVLRMIDRTKTVQGVYRDTQSVHNSSIQKSLLDSVNRLLQIPLIEKEVIVLILQDPILTEDTKACLVEYSDDTSVHTILNLTFLEMLVVVWNRIMRLDSMDEIKKTLNTEMQDAECKCFTGRISRLVNCLTGYDDLVVVQIDDNEQIGTVIESIRTRLGENYNVTEHRQISIRELAERGYSQEVILEWVGYIE